MVHCACVVHTVDRHCTNTPRTCYECCTTKATIHTCPPHYHQMGLPARLARLATGLVHPNILADAVDGGMEEEASAPVVSLPPPPSGQVPAPSPPLSSASAVAPGVPAPGGPPQHPGPEASAAVAPPLSLEAMAATVAAMEGRFTVVQSLLEQLLRGQTSAAQVAVVALPAVAPQGPVAPAPPASVIPALPYIPLPAPGPDMPSLVPPPATDAPHRAAVLDRAAVASQAEVSRLINRFSALDVESDEDDSQVPSQPHTHSASASAGRLPATPLPDAFIPAPAGSSQSAQQQLTAIVNGLNKQNARVKYASIEELNEALDDWVTDSINAGTWTSRQIESMRAYQRLLILRFSISEKRPLKQVLDYHRKWCKAVHAKTIDMFAIGAELNLAILHEVSHPLQLGPQEGRSPSNPQQPRKGGSKTASPKAATTPGTAPAAKYAAGSCVHHPTSTSHTTAMCTKGPKQ
jgi:hypothetical protein